MQISRLFEIVYLLMENNKVTAKDLAKRFEVSPRTIYRDIDMLSQSGIPIYTTTGRGGGIHLTPNFVLNKSLLTKQEQSEVVAGLESLMATNYSDNQPLLSKLTALFGSPESNWVSIDFSDWSEKKQALLSLIKHAVFQQQVVSFSYYNSNGEVSERTAEPIRLWFKNKNWYLIAFCRIRQAVRLFKLNRIKKITLTGETFIKRENQMLPTIFPLSNKASYVTITLLIAHSQAYRVYDDFEEEEITKKENGDFYIQATYIEDDWIYGLILSYGYNAKVLGPLSIQKKVKEMIQKMNSLYDSQE